MCQLIAQAILINSRMLEYRGKQLVALSDVVESRVLATGE